MIMPTPLLVSAEWLQANLTNPNVRPVDVRWYLPEPARGQAEYVQSHIVGAPFVNLDTELSAPKGSGPGRHPIPSAAAFSAVMQRIGVSADTHVVAYDSSGGAAAARLWWLLRYYGHSQVSLLDGGWPAWLAIGGATTAELPSVAAGSFEATPHPELVVDAERVDQLRQEAAALLLDARASERYEGRVEPIDPRAGHIPGAKSAPFAGNLAADGRFLAAEVLRARFEGLGAASAQPLVCYCGSGVTAAHNLFALELAGISGGLLYEGSWSDWSSNPDRPAAIGS
jgi:thiosulfate/3-mercaptopyruvate sulfurtransferase